MKEKFEIDFLDNLEDVLSDKEQLNQAVIEFDKSNEDPHYIEPYVESYKLQAWNDKDILIFCACVAKSLQNTSEKFDSEDTLEEHKIQEYINDINSRLIPELAATVSASSPIEDLMPLIASKLQSTSSENSLIPETKPDEEKPKNKAEDKDSNSWKLFDNKGLTFFGGVALGVTVAAAATIAIVTHRSSK